MLRYKIEVEGEDHDAIWLALDEVRRLVAQGFHSGFNSNDTGNFRFESEEIHEDE